MIGSRNGDAPEHDTGGPGAHARFALAHERLAAQDAARAVWLNERTGWRKRTRPMCIGPGCDRVAVVKGMCSTHHMQHLRGRPLTRIEVKTPRTTRKTG